MKRPFRLDSNLLRIDDTSIHKSRRECLANALIHVGERSRTGICDVYHVWDEHGFKKPSFIETVDPDRVILTLQTEIDGNPDGNFDGNLDDNLDSNDGNPDGNDGDNDSPDSNGESLT